jgi:hypothetical protein
MGRPPRQRGEDHGTNPINVARRPHTPQPQTQSRLLGCHERRGSHRQPLQRGAGQRLFGLRQPKVGDLRDEGSAARDQAVLCDRGTSQHHIRWFQIAVHQPQRVDGRHSIGHLHRQGGGVGDRQGPRLQPVLKRTATNPFHHEERRGLRQVRFINRHNMRMIQTREGLGLALCLDDWPGRRLDREHFQRDPPPQRRLTSPVDGSRTSASHKAHIQKPGQILGGRGGRRGTHSGHQRAGKRGDASDLVQHPQGAGVGCGLPGSQDGPIGRNGTRQVQQPLIARRAPRQMTFGPNQLRT